jgi:hypothetical protein
MTTHTEARLLGRREAIRRVTLLLGGGALIGGDALLTGCMNYDAGAREIPAGFGPDDIALLDEIAETILPETETPGAKAAGVGPFMALMVADTYSPGDQAIFMEGMRAFRDACRERFGVGFLEATPAQRLELVEALDREQWTYMDGRAAARRQQFAARLRAAGGAAPTDANPAEQQRQATTDIVAADPTAVPAVTADAPTHYFRMMKQLALLGYFTSEIGYHQAMRYVETPGSFDPCAPHAPGDRIWAPHA